MGCYYTCFGRIGYRHWRSGCRVSAPLIPSDLVSIMIGGIALSYFIVLAIKSPALEADRGAVVTLLRKIDRNAMPFVALLTVVLVAVLGHLSEGRRKEYQNSRARSERLYGTLPWRNR
jgi:hypothetical protein